MWITSQWSFFFKKEKLTCSMSIIPQFLKRLNFTALNTLNVMSQEISSPCFILTWVGNSVKEIPLFEFPSPIWRDRSRQNFWRRWYLISNGRRMWAPGGKDSYFCSPRAMNSTWHSINICGVMRLKCLDFILLVTYRVLSRGVRWSDLYPKKVISATV